MKKYFTRIASFTAAGLLLTGCTNLPKHSKLHNIEFGAARMNADAFCDPEDLGNRVAKLKPGMTQADVYETLGVSEKKFRLIGDDEKMKFVDPAQVPQPHSVEEQEKMKERAARYSVRELSYKDVRKRGGISVLLTTETQTRGFDLQLRLIFKDGLLERPALPSGIMGIDQYDKETIFQALGDAIKGGVGGGVQGGASNGIKTAIKF